MSSTKQTEVTYTGTMSNSYSIMLKQHHDCKLEAEQEGNPLQMQHQCICSVLQAHTQMGEHPPCTEYAQLQACLSYTAACIQTWAAHLCTSSARSTARGPLPLHGRVTRNLGCASSFTADDKVTALALVVVGFACSASSTDDLFPPGSCFKR